MRKYKSNTYFFIFFLFTLLLVFLSRSIQTNFIKENSSLFFIFNEPIFTNPDAYFFLNNIKEQILSETSFFEKIFSNDLLTGIFVFIYYQVENTSLPEIVFILSPYFVILCFFSTFFFFNSLSKNNYLALLTSFAFILSNIIVTRSSALYFDTDILNLFLFFLIIYFISKLFKKNLARRELFFFSFLIIFFNFLFIHHYPKPIFSLIFLFMIIVIFGVISNKKLDKLVIVILFLASILFAFNGLDKFFNDLLNKLVVYTNAQNKLPSENSSVIETVGELKRYSLYEIEKFLFSKNMGGFGLFLSIFGIGIFCNSNKKKIILFTPLVIFSYLTYKFGIKFIIYIIPYLYFGFFHSIYFFLTFINKRLKNKLSKFDPLILFLGIFFTWNLSIASCQNLISFDCKTKFPIDPYFNKEIVKGIIKFNNLDHDYNIITSLDYGHLISYYSNSSFHISPGQALFKDKYSIFFSDIKITNNYLKDVLEIPNNHKNFLFLTKDFIDWWPTINAMYNRGEDKDSVIIKFNCKEYKNSIINCITEDGLESQINLKNGEIDGSRIVYKIITLDNKDKEEKLFNRNGLLTIFYSPQINTENLFAVFPRIHDNKNFIKYFLYGSSDNSVKLIENNWPYYKIYQILK